MKNKYDIIIIGSGLNALATLHGILQRKIDCVSGVYEKIIALAFAQQKNGVLFVIVSIIHYYIQKKIGTNQE